VLSVLISPSAAQLQELLELNTDTVFVRRNGVIKTMSGVICTGFPPADTLNERGIAKIKESYELVFEQVHFPSLKSLDGDEVTSIAVPRNAKSRCVIL
jgi:hypothetical protein